MVLARSMVVRVGIVMSTPKEVYDPRSDLLELVAIPGYQAL